MHVLCGARLFGVSNTRLIGVADAQDPLRLRWHQDCRTGLFQLLQSTGLSLGFFGFVLLSYIYVYKGTHFYRNVVGCRATDTQSC